MVKLANGSLILTERDIRIIKCVVHDNWQEATLIARDEFGWFKEDRNLLAERVACEEALEALDLTIPWGDYAQPPSELVRA